VKEPASEPIRGRGQALGGGVVAGIIGGVVLAIMLAIGALAKRQDLWPVFKAAAAPFLKERAFQPGFDGPAILLGVICHFAVSIVWGVLFAVIFFGLPRGPTVVWGLVWGFVVWLVMYYVVMPIAGLPLTATEPSELPIISHVFFGLAVALGFLPFQRMRSNLTGPTLGRAPANP
jgi:hypothetical protein